MKTELLSDKQLYVLLASNSIRRSVKQAVESEILQRGLPSERVEMEIVSFKEKYGYDFESRLRPWLQVIIVLLPFFTILHFLFAGRYFANREIRKWRQYKTLLCLGYLLWTIVVFGFSFWSSRFEQP